MKFREISCRLVRAAVPGVNRGCDCDACRASEAVYAAARGVGPHAARWYILPQNDDWMRATSLLYDSMHVMADLGRGRR
jgi:hypothetical protein